MKPKQQRTKDQTLSCLLELLLSKNICGNVAFMQCMSNELICIDNFKPTATSISHLYDRLSTSSRDYITGIFEGASVSTLGETKWQVWRFSYTM